MAFAKAMVYLGISIRRCTNIIGFNAPEWIISFVGASFADCVPVGVYTTNGVDACRYVADHSEAELVVV
jgi:long-chain-fatty-acid--CoA ligase ACSBG